MDVTFYGVRGSTPCSCDANRRYGGNTSSVVLRSDDADPILLDLGTGLRFFGIDQTCDEPLRAHALVSHLHWDHVQGLPFCEPLLCPGSELVVHGPADGGRGFGEAFDALMVPPFFPVQAREMSAAIHFVTVTAERFEVAGAKVTAARVPHTGDTLGYRVERDGVVVVYVSDHQQPGDNPWFVEPAVLELCDGADLLIHDAQYTTEEFASRADWGHCTVDYAVHVAAEAGARALALFHHDPSHDDERIDTLSLDAAELGSERGVDVVFAAADGLSFAVEPSRVRA
ncbi:MAG: MBL fold metallo-hydrolase [Acidimicrobiales bacterium]|nr:MBL fold metallo-hydrolase [Acidimicrobiales bacterium]